MKASLKNYRQSPRKVRLVADLVRGKKVADAMSELAFLPKRASNVMTKLITSAVANAENNFKVKSEDLVISEITVDQGITLKRYRPRARGVAKRINKRTSNIALTLGVKK
ncbi:MAG: 50S ribosomal protein L22 [Candidatus Pacebacteria bacterium]|nr:50S ribosomal protein L22 [Candidatus Paceibacterota bacterium]